MGCGPILLPRDVAVSRSQTFPREALGELVNFKLVQERCEGWVADMMERCYQKAKARREICNINKLRYRNLFRPKLICSQQPRKIRAHGLQK
jgi:hypothetical protein